MRRELLRIERDRARHGDRRARDGVDVLAELERVADVLAAELRRELRRCRSRNRRTARDAPRR